MAGNSVRERRLADQWLGWAANLRRVSGIDKEAEAAYLQRLEGQRELRMSLLPLALQVANVDDGDGVIVT